MGINKKVMAAVNPMAETKDVIAIKNKTGNLYESIVIMAKRANQINMAVKEDLHKKLDEFSSHTDNLEEIHENKEQIEISRMYERMANPALQSTSEFFDDKIYWDNK